MGSSYLSVELHACKLRKHDADTRTSTCYVVAGYKGYITAWWDLRWFYG